MLKDFFKKIWKRKLLFFTIIVVIAGSGFFIYKKVKGSTVETKYVVSAVEKGSVINSISGSGQISSSSEISIKPKVSGDIKTINVKAGQEVKKGDVIATIDSSDAQKTVRDAQNSLASAKLSLEKLTAPSDQLTITQAENALAQAKRDLEELENPTDTLSLTQAENALAQANESKSNAEDDLAKSYEDGFNDVSNVFLDLPSVMSGLKNILYSQELNSGQDNIDYYSDQISRYESLKASSLKNSAKTSYDKAKTAYDENVMDYKALSRTSDDTSIENLINETYETTRLIAEAVKNANNLISFYRDELIEKGLSPANKSDSHLSNLSSYTSKTNSLLSNLLSAKNSIQNAKDSITSATRTITEKEQSLEKIQEGADENSLAAAREKVKEKELSLEKAKNGSADALEVRSQQLSIQQKQNSLSDALEKLADYTVKSPSDGTISAVSAKVSDTASSGTAIATLVSKQKVAEVSLGETDIIKVKVGQKATFTFDAIEDLTLTGEVAEVETSGTTTSGVVSYKVKLTFDSDDERIMSGMSFSVNIITDSKVDVIIVPASAVKTSGEESYVEMPDETIADDQLGITTGISLSKSSTKRQVVQTGLTDGSNTEITSGLLEGDKIITKTIKSSTSSTSTTKNSTTSSSSSRSSTTSKTGTQSFMSGSTMGTPPSGGPPQ